MQMPRLFCLLTCGLVLAATAPAEDTNPTQERADRFLALYNASFQALYAVNSEATWAAVTDVSPVHDASAETAGKASGCTTDCIQNCPPGYARFS